MSSTALQDSFMTAASWLLRRRIAGQDMLVNAHKKTSLEVNEFIQSPSLEELADIYICLVGVSLYNNWNTQEIAQAIEHKIAINENRRWVQQEDGTWQHG